MGIIFHNLIYSKMEDFKKFFVHKLTKKSCQFFLKYLFFLLQFLSHVYLVDYYEKKINLLFIFFLSKNLNIQVYYVFRLCQNFFK